MPRAPYSGHSPIRKATLLEGTGPHPALLVDEILREVFTHLRPSAAEPRNTLEHKSAFDCRRGLSSAAQACRAFYGPAIAALWSVLPGLKVAWALFPSFTLVGDDDTEEYSVDSDEDLEDNFFGYIRNQDTEVNSNFYYTFERDIRQEEWDRFCHYAKHVRVITKHSETYRIHPSVYYQLSRYSRGRPLFPRLLELTWNLTTSHQADLPLSITPTLHFFVTPTLQKFTIWLMYARNTDAADDECAGNNLLLQMVVPLLHDLRELHIYSNTEDIGIDNLAWTSILQLHTLRTLHLEPLCSIEDLEFIAGLATLPRLTELSVSLDSQCEDPDGFARIHGFHALRTLTLTEVDSTGILSPFMSPNIHTLNFSLRYWDSATLELLFHDAITRFPALRSMAVGLSEFGFGPGDQERHMHANIPDFHTLFGMLPLAPALEEFSIRTPMMLSTAVGGDRELARFAETWPRLRALRFVTTLQGDVSPATLIAFARHCPQLHTLHLRGPVIRDTMAEWFPEPPLLESGHGLRELGVCRPPPLDDPGAVASFLRVVFPNMRLATPACCEVCTHPQYYAFMKMPDLAAMLELGVGTHEP